MSDAQPSGPQPFAPPDAPAQGPNTPPTAWGHATPAGYPAPHDGPSPALVAGQPGVPGPMAQQPPTPGGAMGSPTPGQQLGAPMRGTVATAPAGTGYGYARQLGAKPGVIPLRPLTLGEVFDGAFQVMRRMAGPVFGYAVCVAVVVALAQTALQVASMLVMSDWFDTWMYATPDDLGAFNSMFRDLMGLTSASYIFTFVVGVFGQVLLTGLVAAPVSRAVTGHRMSFGEVWRTNRKQIWRVALWALAISGGLFLVACLFAGITAGLAFGVSPAFAALAIVFIPLFLLIACFAFATLGFTPAVLVMEKVGLGAAMRRSWRLALGSFWRVLGVLLLGWLIAYIVRAVLNMPFGFLAMIAALGTGGLDPQTTPMTMVPAQIAVTAFGTIVTHAVAMPFLANVLCLLYVDLRMRHEGLDVQLSRAAAER